MKTNQFILTIGLLFIPSWLFAQQDSAAIKNVKIGQDAGEFGNMYIMAEFGRSAGYKNFVQSGVYMQFDHHYLKIKFSAAYDESTVTKHHVPKSGEYCDCTDANSVEDISFMYGKSFRFFNFMQVQFGAGPSIFIKTTPDEVYNTNKPTGEVDKYKHRYSPGITTEVRYVIQFKRHFALSTAVQMSTNPIRSYSGWSAGAALGLF